MKQTSPYAKARAWLRIWWPVLAAIAVVLALGVLTFLTAKTEAERAQRCKDAGGVFLRHESVCVERIREIRLWERRQ